MCETCQRVGNRRIRDIDVLYCVMSVHVFYLISLNYVGLLSMRGTYYRLFLVLRIYALWITPPLISIHYLHVAQFRLCVHHTVSRNSNKARRRHVFSFTPLQFYTSSVLFRDV